ncbi:MAG TPA: 1-phosphofructokinase family hexose kinase [Sphingomicrobium sp.]|nr:1-phosphofructokinase family hexose kinase [Sphingomicrobium sp.]
MACDFATLTLNPAIDVSSDADEVRPTQKTRIYGQQIEAGGGGVNVAKMLCEFGVAVRAIYLAGGATGGALNEILGHFGMERDCVAILGDTRMSLAVNERATGIEYRFVPEGPEVLEEEWREALRRSTSLTAAYFVASGSLPRGVPDDFYASLSRALRASGTRYVLDTSGAELRSALDEGGIFLLKPSDRELRELVGQELDEEGLATAAAQISASGKAKYVAVTMGADGAILSGEGVTYRLPAIPVVTRSALGAGDSFVGAMTYAFGEGMEAAEAFRLGVAAGAAAAVSKGARLCSADEVRALLDRVPPPERSNAT